MSEPLTVDLYIVLRRTELDRTLWMFAMNVRTKNTCNFIHSSDCTDEKPTTIISRSLNDGFLVFKELIATVKVVQVDTSMAARCINSVVGNDNQIWMWNVIVKLNRARIISDLTRRKWVHKLSTPDALSTEARSAAEKPSQEYSESVVRGLSSLGASPPRGVSPRTSPPRAGPSRSGPPRASPSRTGPPRTSSPRADPTTVVGPTQYSWDALESSLLDFITARSQHEDLSPLEVLVEEQAVANLREAMLPTLLEIQESLSTARLSRADVSTLCSGIRNLINDMKGKRASPYSLLAHPPISKSQAVEPATKGLSVEKLLAQSIGRLEKQIYYVLREIEALSSARYLLADLTLAKASIEVLMNALSPPDPPADGPTHPTAHSPSNPPSEKLSVSSADAKFGIAFEVLSPSNSPSAENPLPRDASAESSPRARQPTPSPPATNRGGSQGRSSSRNSGRSFSRSGNPSLSKSNSSSSSRGSDPPIISRNRRAEWKKKTKAKSEDRG
jgi:hypothetical protein